jgi:hypothetical protein
MASGRSPGRVPGPQGIGYDVAMVSLDLAVLYIEDGRTAEVLRIAEDSWRCSRRRTSIARLWPRFGCSWRRREEIAAELVRKIGVRLETARRQGAEGSDGPSYG